MVCVALVHCVRWSQPASLPEHPSRAAQIRLRGYDAEHGDQFVCLLAIQRLRSIGSLSIFELHDPSDGRKQLLIVERFDQPAGSGRPPCQAVPVLRRFGR